MDTTAEKEEFLRTVVTDTIQYMSTLLSVIPDKQTIKHTNCTALTDGLFGAEGQLLPNATVKPYLTDLTEFEQKFCNVGMDTDFVWIVLASSTTNCQVSVMCLFFSDFVCYCVDYYFFLFSKKVVKLTKHTHTQTQIF